MSERWRATCMIARSPADFKVCYGCGSIGKLQVHTCGICKTYRFEHCALAVCIAATRLGSAECLNPEPRLD